MVKLSSASAIKALFTEFAIIAVIVSVVSVTLNYFNILPLSTTFPVLSFLPQKSVVSAPINISSIKRNSLANKNGSVNEKFDVISLVNANIPKELENTESDYKFDFIGKSALTVPSSKQLIIEADIAILKKTKDGIYSGLLIAKDLKDKKGKTLFLAHDSDKWNLIYREGEEIKTVHFSNAETPGNNIKVSIFINPEGNKVTAKLNNGKLRSLDLKDSFYSSQRDIKVFTQVGSASKIKINALKYLLLK